MTIATGTSTWSPISRSRFGLKVGVLASPQQIGLSPLRSPSRTPPTRTQPPVRRDTAIDAALANELD
jgi:hypothetical protein